MDEFIDYLLQFGNLNQQQKDLILRKAQVIELQKDDYFWEAGKKINYVGFTTKGILRVYYYNNQGEEITRYFIEEHLLILYGQDSDSIYVPSEYLQALERSELVTFSKQHWKEISDTIIGWDNIIQKIVAKQHREKLDRRSQLVSQDATTRYLEFMEKFPDLVNRVPLSHIASYLGITQSSLSRIRKNIG
ncbi:Crp/Fnr family transcriptional regulator [Algoriphagus sp. AGSA1]|uniref:Crp/Fnr family transcriptional regulator n=1 Tax=Algoriphagus sp. AGSA1 TaxID=2907213 RepID=UPI001F2B3CBC|nr:Crp/Fnr family transcriptional regulator [Algoriphagus sp. AGSA1]MCE7053454.1 Crp/Fnr family transcriptional regulator [Algoriphagus sp. AGSA1]